MKKALYLIQLTAIAVLFSSATFADDDWGGHGHHGWGHHGHHHGGHHHGHHGWGRPQVNNYYPQPPQVNNYYPQPQANYYYQQPQQYYYPPQPQYQGGYDNRSHQGLAGGVVGTVFGYELGNGHPLAAGLGAAAGSFLGNGMGWRY